jgi:hypothetical protein
MSIPLEGGCACGAVRYRLESEPVGFRNSVAVGELPPAEDEQAVEALAMHAADPALSVSVRVRCPDGRADHGDPFALEDEIAAATELGVAIVDQEAEQLLVDQPAEQVPAI